MHLTLRCPDCDCALPLDAVDAPPEVACGGCGRTLALSVSEDVRADRTVDTCPVCAGPDFYIRKDFDPKLGLAVVVVGALVSAGFYWFGLDLVAYGILAAAALIDLVIYGRLDDLVVCYRCHTEFRGRYRRTAQGFDLHTADVLELEYRQTLEKQKKAATKASGESRSPSVS